MKINEGTFENFEGEVDGIDEANGRVTVMINIFGRTTPVELEYWQVEAFEPAVTRIDASISRRTTELRHRARASTSMAKQFVAEVEVPGSRRPGHAGPAGGTALGRYGINLGQFVSQFNERTREAGGMPIPVVVKVYSDRTFEFVTKSPPAAAL